MLKGVRHCVARSCRDSNASHILACEIKVEDGSYDSLDEESKKGPCWSALRRAGMTQWTSYQQVMSDTSEQHEGNKLPIPSSIFENKYEKDEVEHETALAGGAPIVTQESRKRKHFLLGDVDEIKPARLGKQRQNGKHIERRQVRHVGSSKDRWSTERYALAEKSMLEILKAEGAVFGNPISRPALRVAARKRIGDTGLLDHLLKHIDGKVAPGGAERFRRWHNTDGVMEYWLESADLVDIRRQARVQDPYWTPPPSYDGGCPPQEDSVHIELKSLRAEIAKMKNEMEETSMKQEQDQAKQIELQKYKELSEWKAKTEQHLIGISSSLNGIQNMYRELVTWKTKTEQQLVEISNALSTVQASKQCNVFSPSASERWEDWLEGTNLDTVPEDDLAPWLGSNDSVNAVQGAAVQGTSLALPPQLKAADSPSQDFVCAKELELLKEEMAKMKRDVQGLVPKKHEEDQANLTPDSSAITTSKADLDSPFLLFQEMCNELVKWKANMEQQVMEVTSCVNSMQASNQVGHHTLNVSSFERWK